VHALRVPFTLVSFHAHPDDEALLTAGTLARAAAEGHRVVLVTATAGEAGLTSTDLAGAGSLGERRRAELETAAAALGVARVVHLGLPDSGFEDSATGDPAAFGALDPERAAAPLVDVLREERADVLTTYDPTGGYGHPDHRQIHRAGALAARTACTASVLEATVERDRLARAARLAAALGLLDRGAADRLQDAYAPRSEITHRIDVRSFVDAKRAAMAAHASQALSEQNPRTLGLLLGLPGWLFARVLGYEWFIDRTRPAGRCDDVFAAVRGRH
jgi:LmbE family N-acetylglucosaminyl deacetylase